MRIRYAFITRKHNLSTSLTDRLQRAQNFTDIESFSHLVRPKIRIAVLVEQLWRSVKYEDVYLKGYATMKEMKAGLKEYFRFYNPE